MADILSLYKKANAVNSAAVIIGSLPVVRTALKSVGVKKGSVTEKLILLGVVAIIGKILCCQVTKGIKCNLS